MRTLLGLQSARVAWRGAATMAVTCTAASGANATTLSFSPTHSNPSISLAGSTSPLYSMTSQSGETSSTKTIMLCGSPGKFGGCDTIPQPYNQVTTTQWNDSTFNSLQPNALIGIASPLDAMPTADEAFSTNSKTAYSYAQTNVSGQSYSAIPFTPYPDIETPLANEYLHLKFDVDDVEYLGLAHFDQGADLDSIEYSAVEPSPADALAVTNVPEPDSWMLLTAGLGLAAATVRPGRNRAARAAAS